MDEQFHKKFHVNGFWQVENTSHFDENFTKSDYEDNEKGIF